MDFQEYKPISSLYQSHTLCKHFIYFPTCLYENEDFSSQKLPRTLQKAINEPE